MKYHLLLAFLWFVGAFSSSVSAKEKVFPGDSLFHLNSDWTDQGGRSGKLSQFAGQTLVLSLVYTSCDSSCPLIVEEMKRIGVKIPKAKQGKVRFVLITLDPMHDKPEVLKAFAENKKLNLNEWTLLVSKDESSVREIAAVLGVKYKKTGRTYEHSNLITVLNSKGEIVYSKPTIGEGLEESVNAVLKSTSVGS